MHKKSTVQKFQNIPTNCPSCNGNLKIKALSCPICGTMVTGSYEMNPFARLNSSDEEFLLCFLISRGSLKEVQERLNMSYPTARNRLDSLLKNLSLSGRKEHQEIKKEVKERKTLDLLEAFEKEEIDFEELIKEINLKG